MVVDAGLYPGFEVMGNPDGSLFTSFKQDMQLQAWSDLCFELASRYIKRYGVDNVRNWRFESWNEPDGECKDGLDAGITCDLPAFLNYFDATEYGLHRADSQLIFGGPASDGSHVFLFALIEHCIHGKHYMTGAPGCGKVDYFNAHLKGDANSIGILEKELPVAQQVYSMTRNTTYSNVRWGNDEADPLVGWSSVEEWRGDARYPAMVVKTIRQHLDNIIYSPAFAGLTYDILSNDNGFLNYPDNGQHTFTQRTLTARFDMNATNSVEFVRKPVMNVMALLSLLGNQSSVLLGGVGPSNSSDIGMIPSLRISVEGDLETTLLMYYSKDSSSDTGAVNVSLMLHNLPEGICNQSTAAAVFVLDNTLGSAQAAWTAMGSPGLPSPQQFQAMRDAMEIPMLEGYPTTIAPACISNTASSITLPLSLPGITALHLCTKPATAPLPPMNLRLHITTTPNPPEVLVYWTESPNTRCVLTYEVYFTPPLGTEQRVNSKDTIFTAFIHAQANSAPAAGCYRVRVTDYWQRSSDFTPASCI
eukprot:m.122801 g.122801  ORF g.122801 m.122801 type:complete len:532 (-) comp15552_c0_seq3:51-1646(-)